MSGLASHGRRRVWASVPTVVLAGGAAMITALGTVVIAFLTQPSSANTNAWLHEAIFWGLLGGVIVTVILLCVQTKFEYGKRTYDPTWAIKFDAIFNAKEMKETRSKAAKHLKEHILKQREKGYTNHDLDDVLDFFEDLGFYMISDQITPEVTHHAFYYWIRGYYSAAGVYMECAHVKRPSQWEYVEQLCEITHEIELERSKEQATKILEKADIDDFLDEEINLARGRHRRS
jgi:hypothetical protein